jgi:uncharacterized SAM-binding protein YcdF (DUF218 family)
MPTKQKNKFSQAASWYVPRLIIASIIWLLGFLLFIERIPTVNTHTTFATDGIVVLTGGQSRLSAGLDLLDKGLAKAMLISGVAPTTEKEAVISQLKSKDKKHFQAWHHKITLGYLATNTSSNAAEADIWRQLHGYKSLILVTGNYHMIRSLLEFKSMMPDCQITPYPVVSEAVRLNDFLNFPNSLLLLANEYNKFLFLLVKNGWRRWVDLFA